MSKMYAYQFDGPPTAVISSVESRMWTEYKKNCVIREITLSNQHKESKSLSGKLHIDYVFTFDLHDLKKPKNQRPVGVSGLATIVSYVRYVENLANGSIFNPTSVVSFTAKKVYADIPKTEFKVTVLE